MSVFEEIGRIGNADAIGDRPITLYLCERGLSVVPGSLGTVITLDEARELAELLIKAADKHPELIEQFTQIEADKAALEERAQAAINEVLERAKFVVSKALR